MIIKLSEYRGHTQAACAAAAPVVSPTSRLLWDLIKEEIPFIFLREIQVEGKTECVINNAPLKSSLQVVIYIKGSLVY